MGDVPRRYDSTRRVHINPARWAEVMATVSHDQLPKYLAGSPVKSTNANEAIGHLVSAFYHFQHGEPFVETLMLTDWSALMTTPQTIFIELIDYLTRQPELVTFTQQIDPTVLSLLYDMNHVSAWRRMEPAMDKALLSAVFWDNKLISEKMRNDMRDAYLYNVELLTTGRLEEVYQQMTPGTEYYKKLLALKLLHDGDAITAFQVFTQQLKDKGGEVFEEPLTNFAYAVAIGLTATGKSKTQAQLARRTGEKLMKSRKAVADNTCYALFLVLKHYLNGKAAIFFNQNPLDRYCHDKMCRRLSVIFVHHYQVLDKEPESFKSITDDAITSLATSLLPYIKRLEPWELALDKLLKMHRPVTASTKAEEVPSLEVERVAYVVNLRSYEVQPKLQKSNLNYS